MQTTLILSREHRQLENILRAFEALLDRTCACDRLAAESLAALIEFFEVYVDGLHQDKEELLLFPQLRARARGDEAARLGTLFESHEGERRLLASLRAHLEGAAYGDPLSLDAFVVAGRAYVGLQRQHLRREDRWLLPLAGRLLTPSDDRWLARAFQRREAQCGAPFLVRAEELLATLECDAAVSLWQGGTARERAS